MEEILTYLLKSSGLLATFFLAYHFLLRKETFFTSNRWFLLSGLVTSTLLPLCFITKTIYVEPVKMKLPQAHSISNESILIANSVSESSSFDWLNVAMYGYSFIVLILFFQLFLNFISLHKIIKNKNITSKNGLSYIDVNQEITPFSFFNYIVFNSQLYSSQELQSILLHEEVHSKEKHSIDVLIAKLFTIVFWINPIVWLYKKAIIQNLEYIADSKAIQKIEDKKCYQMALLKVVTHHNCLPITNHFYQSLIKKRIVMINKNQSNKRNIWKYSLILPVVIAFVFLFQIKVVAQEKLIKLQDGSEISSKTREVVEMNWNKNSPIEEFENDAKEAKKIGLDFTFSDIKRNKKNEITHITISYQDKLGNKNTKEFSKKEGIDSIYFRRSFDQNGKGEIGFYENSTYKEIDYSESGNFKSIYNSHYDSDTEDNLDRLFIINGKPYTKDDLKGKNIAVIESNIIKLKPEEAIKKYGKKAKDGAIIFEGKTEIIDAVLKDDSPIQTTQSKTVTVREIETKEDKNMLLIINGKEYFQKDLKGFTYKCDGSITYYNEEEAIEKYGEKAKDGAMVFNGKTTYEKSEIQKKSAIIFSNDNGDDIIFHPEQNYLKVPNYPSVKITENNPILIVNGIVKSNPAETLNNMDLQKVKSIRVYDENEKVTPATPIKKIVITTK